MASARTPSIAAEPRYERTESEFDDWVAAATERADPFMAWLGVVFALLVGFEIAAEPRPPWPEILEVSSWVIWAAFALEFAVQLWLAPNRERFLRRHWWQPPMILLPTLRLFRFIRLVRVGRALPAGRVLSSSYRAAGTARALFRSRLGYLAGLGVVATIAISELVYLFERDAERGVFSGFGDAVLWALAAVLALQGDPVPNTAGGRLVMILAFVVGLVLIASLAGVIGAYLVGQRDEGSPDPDRA